MNLLVRIESTIEVTSSTEIDRILPPYNRMQSSPWQTDVRYRKTDYDFLQSERSTSAPPPETSFHFGLRNDSSSGDVDVREDFLAVCGWILDLLLQVFLGSYSDIHLTLLFHDIIFSKVSIAFWLCSGQSASQFLSQQQFQWCPRSVRASCL